MITGENGERGEKNVKTEGEAGAVKEKIRDRAVAAGWIAGLLLALSAVFILSRPAQSAALLRAANGALVSAGSPLRLSAPLQIPRGRSAPLGFWYSMPGTADTVFVFAFFRDGALVPSAAVLSPAGEVREIIPLSLHARAVFDSIPQSVLEMHARRLEAVFRGGRASGGGSALGPLAQGLGGL